MRSAHQVVYQMRIAKIINAHRHYHIHIVKFTSVLVVIDLNQPQPIKPLVQDVWIIEKVTKSYFVLKYYKNEIKILVSFKFD